jgi:TPR repeat protein
LFAVLAAGLLSAGCTQVSRWSLACTAGDIQRCKQVGEMYLTGNRVPRDVARAAEFYEKACDAGLADVCNALGEIYEHELTGSADSKRVKSLFDKACAAGSPYGCLNLGLVAANEEELELAALLFNRACQAGVMGGCHYLAEASVKGEGVTKDVAHAVTLYDQACEAEYVDSCLSAATLFDEGAEIQRDVPRATRYYDKALAVYAAGCEAGNQRDCTDRDHLKIRLTLQPPGSMPAKPPSSPMPPQEGAGIDKSS